jgi:hypothetical protein
MKRKESISIAVDEGNKAYQRGVIAGRKEVYDYFVSHNLLCNYCGTIVLEKAVIDSLKQGELPDGG